MSSTNTLPGAGAFRLLAPGLLFALLALLFGFGLGAVFGAAEDSLKQGLQERGRAVLADAYQGDLASMQRVTSKSWTYYKRAHLHANGLGTSALALILLLGVLPGRERLRQAAALASGLGALLYSLFWLLAGMRAPGLGGTGAAKESLQWLALPGSGLCLIGLLLTLVLFVMHWREA